MKEIIMKILSIIIHGRILNQFGNKLQCCLFVLILPCFLCSCDIWHNLTFEGQSHPFICIKTDTGTIRVSCSYFQGCYYLHYGMKGECTVNYDSLKLQTNDNNLVIHNNLPCKGVRMYKLRKEEYLSIRLGFERKDISLGIVNPLVLYILPSDFITFNGQRITNDTLRVELKPGLKGHS